MNNNIILQLDRDLKVPMYIQLYNKLKNLIETGKLEEGEKLPSIRSLAEELGVNNVTVVNAYKQLEQESYVYSKKGSGTYVRKSDSELQFGCFEDENMDLMTNGILSMSENSINFASASPTPELFPVEEFKKVLIEVLNRDKGNAFVYPEINGYGPLRESISLFLKEYYQIDTLPSEIQITSGGQQGIDLLSKTLIQPGDYIFLENPTYSGAVAAFKSRGANIVPISIKEDGIDIEELNKMIKQYHPKFLYIMPCYQSPTTYSYSEQKKIELLNIAYENNLYIIEDDFLSDLSYGEKRLPLKTMDTHGHVVYIKSFSKILMPGLRIGFLTAPKKIFGSIVRAKHTTDITSSGFIQRAFDLYLRSGFWKSHIERTKIEYGEKYQLLLKKIKSLEKHNISFKEPKGGLSIWLKLPENINSVELYNECAKNNVIIVPGEIFFINKNKQYSNYIRLSFGSVSKREIISGIKTIDECISSLKGEKTESTKYIPLI
ncbi:MocR-like pyridoxine biosynthesis transcription factor PdxR [Anaerosalibacter sp. Marseille-P3206]|uniref:MocR-like pyridoxine biosynthesis transcription factor PdxR n=1 Tax=Anaerosalibacter sp. Marseille-P3206 TaxID=1871005 RepID=UPI0009848B28|nr:PLP-dependent aminotransferase family protein [Anaerosalibacter sp. Marseille-P3206]